MKQLTLLLSMVVISSLASGQKAIQEKTPDRIVEIKKYIDNAELNAPFYILDSLIIGFGNGLSGNSVKDGKLAATSLTVTDKGASMQLSLASFSGLHLGFNIAGSGEDKFINVVKDGKYQSSLSAGAVINFFPSSASGFFKKVDAWQTREIVKNDYQSYLNKSTDDPFDASKDTFLINSSIRTLRLYEKLLLQIIGENDESTKKQTQEKSNFFSDPSNAKLIIAGRIARDTLIALGYLQKNYVSIHKIAKRIELIPSEVAANEIRDKKYVAKVEKELMNGKWTAFSLTWWTLKPSYNVKPYKMVNAAMAEDHFADTYNDNFFSVELSFNQTMRKTVGSQFQFTYTPTINLSNGRDFSSLIEQTITQTRQIDINGTPIEEVLWNTKGYKEKPERNLAWSLEVPLIFFWNKYNFGFEIAGRAGINNPYKDNFGGKLGVFIPVEIKDGTPIWIEPLIKVGKLGNTKKNDEGVEEPLSFWKDNFEFGFNVSVALPAFKIFANR